MKTPVYQQIASSFQARQNCEKKMLTGAGSQNAREWEEKHTETIEAIVRDHFPSGAGFDSGTTFDWVQSKPERLVFETSFHHMNEVGMYDGWTEHEVIVTPSLQFGFNVRVTGKNRNEIKTYIADEFYGALSTETEN